MITMVRIKSDKIIVGERLFDGYLYIQDGKIAKLSAEALPCEEAYDYTGLYVSPGFIDLHTHGAGGYSYSNSSVEDVIAAYDFSLKHGTTCVLPTVTTDAFAAMRASAINVEKAMATGKVPGVYGVHMEGPYLSKNQCGAQNTTFITPPVKADYADLMLNHKGLIKRWSYAPENDPNGEFCKFITSHGATASAGHTDAIYDDMKVAIANGCNSVTHLYSCTSTITRDHGFRRLGVIETAYLEEDMYVEIIADGKHLPYDLIRLILKNKGSDRVALVTDSMAIAGTSVKEGNLSGTEYIVEDNVCKLKDRSAFAGSVATAGDLIRTMVFGVGCSVPEAVKMLTKVPAEMLGVNKGQLTEGKDADIVVFDGDIAIKQVFLAGKKV